MAKIDKTQMTDWNNGNIVTEAGLEKDLELLRVQHNALDDKIDVNKTSTDNGLATHKAESVLDHPDGSVTRAKIANQAVDSTKIADGSIYTNHLVNSTVNSDKLTTDSVTTEKVVNKAITYEKLGMDLQASVGYEYEWTATEGQTLFELPSDLTYPVGTYATELVIGGLEQSSDAYIEASPSSVETTSAVPTGVKVKLKWRNGLMPTTSIGHQGTHQKGGLDPIRIDTLDQYQELVADKIGSLSGKIENTPNLSSLNKDGINDDITKLQTIMTDYTGKIVDLNYHTFYISSPLTIPASTTIKNATFILATTAYLSFGEKSSAENIVAKGISSAYANIGFLIPNGYVRLKNVTAQYCEKGFSIDSSINGSGFWAISLNGFRAYNCNTGLSIFCDDEWMTGHNFTDGLLQVYEYGIKATKGVVTTQFSHFNFDNIIVETIGGKSYATTYALYLDTTWSNYHNIQIFNDYGPECYGLYLVNTVQATSINGGYQNNNFSNITLEGKVQTNDLLYCNKLTNVIWLNKFWYTDVDGKVKPGGTRSRDRIANEPRILYSNKDITTLDSRNTVGVTFANGEFGYDNSATATKTTVQIWVQFPKHVTNTFLKSNYVLARLLFEIYDSNGVDTAVIDEIESFITGSAVGNIVATGFPVHNSSDIMGHLKGVIYTLKGNANTSLLTRDDVCHVRFVIKVPAYKKLTVKSVKIYNHLCLLNGQDDQQDYIPL